MGSNPSSNAPPDSGSTSPRGYLAIVLHAHLPFVRHPDHPRWLEEDWLYEAIGETYLPLIKVFRRLVDHDVRFRLTLSISPTLAAMLADDLLQKRFVQHIDRLIDLARKEVERTKWSPEFHPLARRYLEMFEESKRAFVETYQWDLLGAFRSLEEAGVLELITCGATHGFLPLMLGQKQLWRAQIAVAAAEHERHFGKRPRGFWLPECGYQPGIEEVLADEGIEYFFVDTHGLLHATPRPHFGVYAPIQTAAGPVAFGRDQQSSRQVWSAEAGYPGDADYREFYRDIGWDLDYEYIKPFLHSDGHRTNLGIKYYRVTKKEEHKEAYDFARAQEKSAVHAADFLERRIEQVASLTKLRAKAEPSSTLHAPQPPVGAIDARNIPPTAPLIVAPYDAELFGHWWFEGPQWLEYLFLKMHYDQQSIETVTASDYLARVQVVQQATPSMSSWGHNGFCEYWLDPANDWVYPLVQEAGERMIQLADDFGAPATPEIERALRQAAREMLLLQSSDWAFILKTGTVVEYARWRVEQHLANFNQLEKSIRSGVLDLVWLAEIESKTNLFPAIDPRVFRTRPVTARQPAAEPIEAAERPRSDPRSSAAQHP